MGALVNIAPAVVWPWHLRWCGLIDRPCGAECIHCYRPVAVEPTSFHRPVCLYCALDRGLIDAVDQPFCDGKGSDDRNT